MGWCIVFIHMDYHRCDVSYSCDITPHSWSVQVDRYLYVVVGCDNILALKMFFNNTYYCMNEKTSQI